MNLKHTEPGYMVQLDGLRAIAVAIVILFHWTPEVKETGLGGLGVQLFFVLSGYLITGILLDARTKAEHLGASKAQIVKSFYARRFLRIFPLYYLVIGVAALLGSYNVLHYLGWHLGYLTNFAIFREGFWIGEASHLWSLAVEEQFYLFWPFVILFTPRRYLTATIVGFILLAPVFKLTCAYFDIGGARLGVLPISSFHYLGAGALLAKLGKSERFKQDAGWRKKLAVTVKVAGIVGLTFFTLCQFYPQVLTFNAAIVILREFALICLFLSMTMGAAYGFDGLGGKLLASKPMVFIGQISYGLYLLHNFVPYFITKHFQNNNIVVGKSLGSGALLVVYSLVLLGLSAASWFFFERKLNKYKSCFPYVLKQQKKAVIA
ncbi:acyltransferase family protein [Pontibacter fetidus]|uniref:Acyltransferase n=1 Tax=Pontibacter fetidus TaxID=2700082 RepID=A0A6B2H0N0_9BACT|nr:acyltransferase [Pontibacter fetidus]NDK55678.1 acyltransferase [Pontibacter fetidus]